MELDEDEEDTPLKCNGKPFESLLAGRNVRF